MPSHSEEDEGSMDEDPVVQEVTLPLPPFPGLRFSHLVTLASLTDRRSASQTFSLYILYLVQVDGGCSVG